MFNVNYPLPMLRCHRSCMFSSQNCAFYVNPQKKCETIAHFSETLAHIFLLIAENSQLCKKQSRMLWLCHN